MPLFSADSLEKLATCHPELQVLFHEVIKEFDCTILEGHRDQAAQEADFADEKTKLHYPFGKHNAIPSNAVDVAPYPINWQNFDQFHFFAGYVSGIAAKLRQSGLMTFPIRWGGAWDGFDKLNSGDMLNDFVHFELILA